MKRLRVCLSLFLSLVTLLYPGHAVFASSGPSFTSEMREAIQRGIIPADMQSDYQAEITRLEFCRLLDGLEKYWSEGSMDLAAAAAGRGLDRAAVQFTDTNDTTVLACDALGIVAGVGGGKFNPEAPITRQEAARMLYNTAEHLTQVTTDEFGHYPRGQSVSEFPHIFGDSREIRSWARKEITWVYRYGVMAGTNGNLFKPNDGLTREQACTAALRLFNVFGNLPANTLPPPEIYPVGTYSSLSGLVELTSPAGYVDSNLQWRATDELGHVWPFTEKYAVVTDSVGVGIGSCHIIDNRGKTLLADFKGTAGRFAQAQLFGNLAELYDRSGGGWLVNLADGTVYNQTYIMDNYAEGMLGAAFQQDDGSQLYGYFNENGQLTIPPVYLYAGAFRDGKAAVQKQDGTYELIDRTGREISQFLLDFGPNSQGMPNVTLGATVLRSLGDMLAVEFTDGEIALYTPDRAYILGDCDNILLCQNGQFICEKNWRYTLYNANGTPVSASYANDLNEIAPGRYLGQINGTDYALIDENGDQLAIFHLRVGGTYAPYNVITDDSGLFVYQQDKRSLVVTDYFGKQIGVITQPYDIGTFQLVNGLIYLSPLEYDGPGENTENPELNPPYYFPNGKRVMFS